MPLDRYNLFVAHSHSSPRDSRAVTSPTSEGPPGCMQIAQLRRNLMMRKAVGRLSLVTLAFLVFVPATTFGQSVIAGVVKDPTGAVMPGVTVEAASPVLIERVRSVVTDG